MIGYMRRLADAYHLSPEEADRQEKGRRLWVLFDQNGFDVVVGDCVACTNAAITRDIKVMTIH